jgi:hypothetical protein
MCSSPVFVSLLGEIVAIFKILHNHVHQNVFSIKILAMVDKTLYLPLLTSSILDVSTTKTLQRPRSIRVIQTFIPSVDFYQ